MKKNMGITDRNIRILLAVSVAVLYYLNVITGALALVLVLVIGILLTTSLFRVCPLYLPFGYNTLKKTKKSKTKHEVHPT
ncbi:MAG: DUF2892 domain-containing protein [Marinoscillum sp.]|uniref:YgaP family membrane protein n=1 Tax=Marinoscillum sp. TaxID=2024838 RepID=UPI0032F5DC17